MFTLVLVSRSWNGKRSLKIQGTYKEFREAEQVKDRKEYHQNSCFGIVPDYRILGPRQLEMLKEDIAAEQKDRRAKGAKKAAATRKKRGQTAFIRCPKCGAKSKLLHSEMGGLQTRRCQGGHTFEYDKWIADRAFWAFVK